MRKTLLSVSLWLLPTGCPALLDLKDVQIVDGGSDPGTDGAVDSAMTDRMYRCGYAAPGNNCDKKLRSQTLRAPDMTAAIAACKEQMPRPKLDFCYVKDDDGRAATDESQCMAASGSWRPDGNCCNFLGTLSCPATP